MRMLMVRKRVVIMARMGVCRIIMLVAMRHKGKGKPYDK
jgi:hypothetical protein